MGSGQLAKNRHLPQLLKIKLYKTAINQPKQLHKPRNIAFLDNFTCIAFDIAKMDKVSPLVPVRRSDHEINIPIIFEMLVSNHQYQKPDE